MTPALKIPPTLTAAEAAAVLDVHIETVYRYANRGHLATTSIGGKLRVSKDSLEQLLVTGIPRKRPTPKTAPPIYPTGDDHIDRMLKTQEEFRLAREREGSVP